MCPPTREGTRDVVIIRGGGAREPRPQEVMIIIMMTEITGKGIQNLFEVKIFYNYNSHDFNGEKSMMTLFS